MNSILFRLFARLRCKEDWHQMEEHFSRQAQAAEFEVATTSERLRKATLSAMSPLRNNIGSRYRTHRRSTSNPALAEMATIREVQNDSLDRAFSLLDFGDAELAPPRRTNWRPPS